MSCRTHKSGLINNPLIGDIGFDYPCFWAVKEIVDVPEFALFSLEMAPYPGFKAILGRAYVGIKAFSEMTPA